MSEDINSDIPVGTVLEQRGWLHGPPLQSIAESTLRGNAISLMGTVHNCDWILDHLKILRAQRGNEKGEALITATMKLLEMERDRAADAACEAWTKYKEVLRAQK